MKFKKIYFVRIVLGKGQLSALSLGLRDIQNNMSMVLDTSYLTHYDSLLQNATDIITKCDSYFITKCDWSLLQNASGFLLQNAVVIAKCDDFITKCNSNYKIRRLLQIALVQCGLKIITFGPISETF